jgi:hypothetical protein
MLWQGYLAVKGYLELEKSVEDTRCSAFRKVRLGVPRFAIL